LDAVAEISTAAGDFQAVSYIRLVLDVLELAGRKSVVKKSWFQIRIILNSKNHFFCTFMNPATTQVFIILEEGNPQRRPLRGASVSVFI
jgi:hypothetical protein